MVVVFLTSTFKDVVNGPAKFANLLLELNDLPEVALYVLTEDIPQDRAPGTLNPYVIPIDFKPTFLNLYDH